MRKIENVTLEFNCPEKPDATLFCGKCAHTIIDFTNKAEQEIQEKLKNAKGPVCGFFRRSQLSDQFLKYTAATFIASSLTFPTLGQESIKGDSLINAIEKISTDDTEEEIFLGMIVEIQAEPVGGYKKFMKTIKARISCPKELKEKGKSFIEFTIDTLGQMTDIKLVKGFDVQADKEAIRVMSSLDYPFVPGKQRGKAVKAKLVIPIIFDPEN